MSDLLSFDEAMITAGTSEHSRESLESMVCHLFGATPEDSFFRRVTLPISRVDHLVSSLDDYAKHYPGEYITIVSLIDAYKNEDSVPPIIFGRNVDALEYEDGLEIMDGFHRLCAASAAGLSTIDALEFVYPNQR